MTGSHEVRGSIPLSSTNYFFPTLFWAIIYLTNQVDSPSIFLPKIERQGVSRSLGICGKLAAGKMAEFCRVG
jgi:hypothetical protein